ncbi:unnamed protein product [Aspergillus oryzae]|nr:unnamed protein product [Aspergillus oryzae]GMF83414.1 unnamed protein product [Aspergillus oryzae]
MEHPKATPSHYKFKLLPEFFVNYHEIARQSPNSKVTTQPSLGLIDQPYSETTNTQPDAEPKKPWERFAAYIRELNTENPDRVTYKVLYLTRHGLGVHNVFEAKVGKEAWNVSYGTPSFHPVYDVTDKTRATGPTSTETVPSLG